MKTFRLYTGNDGQSHIEPIDLERTPSWTKGLATTRIAFRESPVGNFIDWHPAPRRQFVIILSGQLEIGLGDGSKHLFGPGDARLLSWDIVLDRDAIDLAGKSLVAAGYAITPGASGLTTQDPWGTTVRLVEET